MERWLSLSESSIDEAALVGSRSASSTSGAVLCFSGVVRGLEQDQPVDGIDYEVFRAMAERQFHLLLDEMEARWPVESIRLVHRVGRVPTGETSLWVEVRTPHRGESFAALAWLIEQMKRRVPIWKHPYP